MKCKDGERSDHPYSAEFRFKVGEGIKAQQLTDDHRCCCQFSFLLCAETMAEENGGEMERSEWNSDDDDEFVDAEDNLRQTEEGEVVEPYVGMEFESEDDARRFYNDYARRVGFTVRIMQRRRSEIDGRTLARRIGCNKQGFSPNTKGKVGQERKPRPRVREGCKASILFKLDKSGKWVVTRFVKDHNHPLVIAAAQEHTTLCDKEKKIRELSLELQRQEELCALYRERLINLLDNIENQSYQFSSKVLAVVQSVREAESEALLNSRL